MKTKCKCCGKMRDCTKFFGEYVCYACYNDIRKMEKPFAGVLENN